MPFEIFLKRLCECSFPGDIYGSKPVPHIFRQKGCVTLAYSDRRCDLKKFSYLDTATV